MLVVQVMVAVLLVTEAFGVVMVSAGVSVRVMEPTLVGSSVLVAVITAEVPVEGAVKTPADVMEPAEADQVSAVV
jgi:hypothetical protein